MFSLGMKKPDGEDGAVGTVANRCAKLSGSSAPLLSERDGPPSPDAGKAELALAAITAGLSTLRELRRKIRAIARPVIVAAGEADPAARAILADEYDQQSLRAADDLGVDEETDAAVPVLVGPTATPLVIPIGVQSSYRIPCLRLGDESNLLDLPPPLGAFCEPAEIDTTLRALQDALGRVDDAARRLVQSRQYLMDRLAMNGPRF